VCYIDVMFGDYQAFVNILTVISCQTTIHSGLITDNGAGNG